MRPTTGANSKRQPREMISATYNPDVKAKTWMRALASKAGKAVKAEARHKFTPDTARAAVQARWRNVRQQRAQERYGLQSTERLHRVMEGQLRRHFSK